MTVQVLKYCFHHVNKSTDSCSSHTGNFKPVLLSCIPVYLYCTDRCHYTRVCSLNLGEQQRRGKVKKEEGMTNNNCSHEHCTLNAFLGLSIQK